MKFTQNDRGKRDILNKLEYIKNEVQIQCMMAFRQNIKNIPPSQYLNTQFL